ncbi:MAG TPA: DUF4339 domain-containing protein [Candidatus Hydrogenedentes bacterium]|nr:DUF4339 domain-containing protein [Candidatus Hydrogenedentota bacterium]HIJ73968.1 DUF4339 domain-containing protein [Candidatus Hydrogenedentota bacterium]
MERKWYVLDKNDEQRGPLTEDEVRALVSSRALTATDYCWCEDLDDWVVLDEVAAFAAALGSPETDVGGGSGAGWGLLRETFERGKRGAVRTMATAKLKVRLAKLRRTREKLCAALGEEVYREREELSLRGAMEMQVKSLVKCDEDIAAIERAIAEVEAEPR